MKKLTPLVFILLFSTGFLGEQRDNPPRPPSGVSAINTFPYHEDFELGAAGWTHQAEPGGANDWVLGTPSKTQLLGAHSGSIAFVTKTTGHYSNNHHAAVYSPAFNFSGLAADPRLEFWHNFLTEDDPGADVAALEYSTDGGTSWTKVDNTLGSGSNFNTSNSTNWYNNGTSHPNQPLLLAPNWNLSSTAYLGHNAGWIKSTTVLAGTAGQSDVRLRWRFATDFVVTDEGWAIDDVSIYERFSLDVGPEQIIRPNSYVALNALVTPRIRVRNFGLGPSGGFSAKVIIRHSGGAIVYSDSVDVNTLPPNGTSEAILGSSWSASSLGFYTVVAITRLTGDSFAGNDTLTKSFAVIEDTRTNLIPDGGGYVYSASNSLLEPRPGYGWIEAGPGFGTWRPLDHYDDGVTGVVVLPESFLFYGLLLDSIQMSANGLLAFVDASTGNSNLIHYPLLFEEERIPDTTRPNYIIAPLWADLEQIDYNITPGSSSGIYTRHVGSRFIIQWHRFKFLGAPVDSLKFQVVLDYSDNSITFAYASLADGGYSFSMGSQRGSVGIEGNGMGGSLRPYTNFASVENKENGAGSKRGKRKKQSRRYAPPARDPENHDRTMANGSNYYFQGDKFLNAPAAGVSIRFALSEAALPVTLSSFAAQINPGGSGVLLEWTTISEINNYGFYVQRRAEGQTTFTDISNSFTPGAGTTLEPQYYSFLDTTLTSTGIYHYRLRQVDLDGSVHYSHAISIEVLTLGVEEGIPHEFRVFQNYPNPFNPVTTITFSVEKAERTAVILYDILGQEIARIYDEFAEPGRYYNVKVDASAMGSGVYFYRVVTETRSETRKMLLLR